LARRLEHDRHHHQANVSLQGIAIFDDGTIAVSDAGNAVIWAMDPITRVVTKLTGQLGIPGIAVGATNFGEIEPAPPIVPRRRKPKSCG